MGVDLIPLRDITVTKLDRAYARRELAKRGIDPAIAPPTRVAKGDISGFLRAEIRKRGIDPQRILPSQARDLIKAGADELERRGL